MVGSGLGVVVAPAALAASGPVISTSSLPPGEVGLAYSAKLVATGGTSPYTWTLSGALPTGMSFSTSGQLSGTPKATASLGLGVTVTDHAPLSASTTLTLTIAPGPSITTASLPDATAGTGYAVQLSASGGVAPYAWSIASGAIPGGLVLSSAGLLSGRPGVAGSSSVQLKVVDGAGVVATRTLTFTIDPVPLPTESLVVGARAGAVFMLATAKAPTVVSVDPSLEIADVVATTGGTGALLLTTSGRVLAVGTASALGSVGERHLVGHTVGLALDAAGTGYWVVTDEGHVYGFGTAHARGNWPRARRTGRVVGIAASPSINGYWLDSASGQVAAFGPVRALGSAKATRRNPVVAITADPQGSGYWLAIRSGVVSGFGTARRYGERPPGLGGVVGIAAASTGSGYWLLTGAGLLVPFGSAQNLGTLPPTAGAFAAASGGT